MTMLPPPAPPRQPLPRPIVPLPGETIGSYLARLAAANRLDATALRAYLATDTAGPAGIHVDQLATVSGQPERSLRHAIADLGATEPPQHRAGDAAAWPPCQLCSAARGHTEAGWPSPLCRHRAEDAVCIRHRRWLGDPADPAQHGQLNLADHPVIVRSNMTHRRLITKHGRDATESAYRDARGVCHAWHQRREHQQQFIELMSALRPGRSQVASTDPAIGAALYPQTVAITRLLVSPHWCQTAHDDWPGPRRFIRELQRTAAPDFYWSLGYPYGPREPLIAVLIRYHKQQAAKKRRVPRRTR